MSNWDFTADGSPARNFQNGRFLKGHIPHNKGKKWFEWLDERKQSRIRRIGLKNLKGKVRMDLGGWNAKKIVALRESDGKWWVFASATQAAQTTGLNRRNITRCCQGKCKHCGEFRWFYWESNEWVIIAREHEQI